MLVCVVEAMELTPRGCPSMFTFPALLSSLIEMNEHVMHVECTMGLHRQMTNEAVTWQAGRQAIYMGPNGGRLSAAQLSQSSLRLWDNSPTKG